MPRKLCIKLKKLAPKDIGEVNEQLQCNSIATTNSKRKLESLDSIDPDSAKRDAKKRKVSLDSSFVRMTRSKTRSLNVSVDEMNISNIRPNSVKKVSKENKSVVKQPSEKQIKLIKAESKQTVASTNVPKCSKVGRSKPYEKTVSRKSACINDWLLSKPKVTESESHKEQSEIQPKAESKQTVASTKVSKYSKRFKPYEKTVPQKNACMNNWLLSKPKVTENESHKKQSEVQPKVDSTQHATYKKISKYSQIEKPKPCEKTVQQKNAHVDYSPNGKLILEPTVTESESHKEQLEVQPKIYGTVVRIDYEVGEIVWARIKGYPAWPAKIKAFPSERMALVVWFNDYRQTKVYRTQLSKFLPHFDEHAVKFYQTIGLRTAAKEALICYGNRFANSL